MNQKLKIKKSETAASFGRDNDCANYAFDFVRFLDHRIQIFRCNDFCGHK